MSVSNVLLIKDLDQIDWNISAIGAWNVLLKVLRHANTMNDADRSDQLINKIAFTVENMLNDDRLIPLWRDICSISALENEMSLLNAHRMISNVLREKTPECASQHHYSQTILKSLINYIEDANEMRFSTIEAILSTLSDPYLWVFAVSLCGHIHAVPIIKKLMHKISPYWSLNLSKLILKYMSKQVIDSNATDTDITRSRSVVTLLIEYITQQQQAISTAEIIDNLIMNNSIRLINNEFLYEVCDILAATVVSALLQEAMPAVVDVVAGVWGDRAFVATADIPKQTLYTQVLVHSLHKSKREYLYIPSPNTGVTLDLLLSLGISSYLDIDNINIRKHGMQIAQIYAGLLGETLHFAELDNILQQEKERIKKMKENKAQSEKVGKIDTYPSVSKGKIPINTTTAAVVVAEDYDSDSSVELTAYKLDDGGSSKTAVYDYKDKLLRTNYLRDCLQMLRCPDSKPEARQQLQAALERIPIIMASNPPDALDLCQPLMHELLVVSNAFNIPEFDQQRNVAVQSVLQANPTIAVPFLTASLLGSDLPLGLKLAVLEWLVAAAKILSNIPENEQLVSPKSSTPAESNRAIEANRSIKTVIKRPGMLAAQQKRTKYFRNHFGPLAPLFIYPLMQLLGKVYNNTLNEITRPHSADKFNLIAELFETNGSPSDGGGVNNNGVQRDDELKHLDGVDALLPSQCLVALGTFVQCAINTPKIRDYALEIATVAGAFRQASAVALRRAALFALRLSFEAYLPSPTAAAGGDPRHRLAGGIVQQTPLQALQNITPERVYMGGEDGESAESGEAAMLSIMTQPALVSVIDWAASTWKADPDEISRALKHDIVTMAVNGVKL